MELSDFRGDLKNVGHRRLVAALLAVIAIAAVAAYVALDGGTTTEALAAEPATVEPVAGTDLMRITLSTSAMKRLDVKTAAVRTVEVDGKRRSAVPYGAVFYDAHGETWVYVSRKPRTFVRERISVDYIDGTDAFLSAGPSVGTRVATVGVQELFGAESGIAE